MKIKTYIFIIIGWIASIILIWLLKGSQIKPCPEPIIKDSVVVIYDTILYKVETPPEFEKQFPISEPDKEKQLPDYKLYQKTFNETYQDSNEIMKITIDSWNEVNVYTDEDVHHLLIQMDEIVKPRDIEVYVPFVDTTFIREVEYLEYDPAFYQEPEFIFGMFGSIITFLIVLIIGAD